MPLHICSLTGTARLIALQTIIAYWWILGAYSYGVIMILTGQHWWTHVAFPMLQRRVAPAALADTAEFPICIFPDDALYNCGCQRVSV